MINQFLSIPIFRAFTAGGLPLAGGLLYAYAAGTVNPQNTYSSIDNSAPNTNPVVLDSTGSATVRLDPTLTYDLQLTDANGDVQWTVASYQGNQLPLAPLTVEGSSVLNAQYPYGDYRRYGASTANADNALYIRNALATGLPIIHANETYLVNSPIIQSVAGQYIAWYGTLTAGAGWTGAAQVATVHNNLGARNSNGTLNNCVFSHNGTGSIIDNFSSTFIDCAGVADGYQAEGQTSGGRTVLRGNPNIIHTLNFQYAFLSSFQGDSKILGASGQQWLTTDTQWLTQSNTTSAGIIFNRGDCTAEAAGNLRWLAPNVEFGPYSSNCGYINAHPYDGGANGSAAWLDPVSIKVDERSSGCWAKIAYLDQSNVIIKSADFTLEYVMPFQFATSATFSLDAGQPTPNLVKVYCANHPALDGIRIKGINKFVSASNTTNNLPTSPVGYYPSDALALLSLTGNGTTGQLTYVATTDFPPQTNLEFFLTGANSASFDKLLTAGAFTAGRRYQILTVGTTDYTAIGAVVNAVGHVFTANGVGAGTGTAYEAYINTSATQTVGGAGVGVVTMNFATSVNATASVAGSIQRTWHADMNGSDVVTAAIFGTNGFEDFEIISSKVFMSHGASQPQMVWGTGQSTYEHLVKCGNGLSVVSFYGNLSGANPYIKHNIQQLQLAFAGGASTAYNASGVSVGDDGSGNLIIKTGGVQVAKVFADGGITIGSPTGGSKGAGTLNIATGLYVNNVAVTVP